MTTECKDIISINSLGLQAPVSPSEQIYVLSSSQLGEIIEKALLKATEALASRIDELESFREIQSDACASLARKLKTLEGDPQPLQRDRGEILRALLAANGDKMLAKEARQKMRMDKATFSRLLDTLAEYIESKPFYQDKRKLVLILKN